MVHKVFHDARTGGRMKTCSKCKKDLPLNRFVKSPRYFDGLYPSCKDCRKRAMEATLKTHPLCSKCKSEPHTKNHTWCYSCQRVGRGQASNPKFRRVPNNRLCSKCKIRERAKSKRYCCECANKYLREWFKSKGGFWNAISEEQRQKATARKYAYNRMIRGKLQRKTCEVCGATDTEIHHLNYNPKTLDIKWLCRPHHEDAERVKKSLLTEQPLLL